jgi:hypothetical protein
MSKVITPAVGRKVWYRPTAHDLLGPGGMSTQGPNYNDHDQCAPLDATVIAVWGDRMVNVLVTDIMGKQFPVLSCDLLQEGDEPRRGMDGKKIGRYVEWMPYQKGQAAKQDAAEAQAKASAEPK